VFIFLKEFLHSLPVKVIKFILFFLQNFAPLIKFFELPEQDRKIIKSLLEQ